MRVFAVLFLNNQRPFRYPRPAPNWSFRQLPVRPNEPFQYILHFIETSGIVRTYCWDSCSFLGLSSLLLNPVYRTVISFVSICVQVILPPRFLFACSSE